MTPEDPELDALLESVASHARIDWDDAEARAASREDRSRLRGLRDVARVAEFHRTLQHSVAPGPGRREVEAWGDLLLLERVGSGTSGDVYRAWDPALQREVALKLLHPRGPGVRDADLWLEEARALARVRDPHVVSVFGAAEHQGRAGLWMEFLRGPTLEQVLADRGPLPADAVARLGAQLGRALGAVHAAGALHRDLKPANVILEPDGRAVLTDFGLGRRRSSDRDPDPFSGSPMFMSPQRLAGAQAKATDDLYALGVTLRWALVGAPPYRAGTVEELRAAGTAGPARSLSAERPEAPAALVAAIDRAMQPDPAARFPNASALAAAFEAAGGVTRPRNAPARRVGPGLWVATVLAVAALAGWIAVARLPRRETPRPAVVAPAPAPGAYDVSASFLRRGRDRDARLDSGDRVAPGDRVSLEFYATRPVWLYVLDADERGECYLLFPQPLFDRRNPLPEDSTIVLPGTRSGQEYAWTVTSRGGREHLLVVASPEPMAELEAELSHLPAPVPGHPVSYARVTASTMERLRGMGGVSEVPPRPSRSGPAEIFEHIRSLAGAEQGVRGTWVRQIILENPLR